MHERLKKIPPLQQPSALTAAPTRSGNSDRQPAWMHALQTKFTVNQPGDAFEQQADHLADKVIRLPEPQVQRAQCACGGQAYADGECEGIQFIARD